MRKADKFVVLENGGIVETGTHEELMETGEEIYRSLNEMRFAV